MIKQLKSAGLMAFLVLQRSADYLYRAVTGIPQVKWSRVTSQLYLGGQYSVVGIGKMKLLGITAVVNMRMTSIYSATTHEGLKYLHLPTIDNTPPTIADLLRGAEFIDHEIRHHGKVYIHCRQGIGRGPSMAIAYLLKAGETYEDAYRLVSTCRPFIAPKQDQVHRLRELESYYNLEKPKIDINHHELLTNHTLFTTKN